jgi:SAM-dependent methyltransferase
MSAYNYNFYTTMIKGAEESASRTLPALFEVLQPKSMLDLGCGVGCWLKVAKELGVEKVIGFDGAYVNPSQLRINRDEFNIVDLAKNLPPVQKVELAMSLEVAEHVPETRAEELVDYLTQCSDFIFFGAAIPLQGGTDHINEQWQSYWVEKFRKRGYIPCALVRDALWDNPNIGVWYRQNALIYYKKGSISKLDSWNELHGDSSIINVVHPDLYHIKMLRYIILERLLTKLQKIKNRIYSALGK